MNVADPDSSSLPWVERAVERSAAVQRSRDRIANQVKVMLEAARRLIRVKGDEFTTQELVAEAGVALQTFYRYFASKDELLLAYLSDAMADACARWAEAAQKLPDPLSRLHLYVVAPLEHINDGDSQDVAESRYIVSIHWRLHRLSPNELAAAEKPLVDLLASEIEAAVSAGVLRSANPQWDAWFIVELVRSAYHYYAYAAREGDDMNVVKERLWRFCLGAMGGRRT